MPVTSIIQQIHSASALSLPHLLTFPPLPPIHSFQSLYIYRKRTENIPGLVAKKEWENVRTELTSYSYNLREAMLRLADTSSNPKAATKAAKAYFSDINDIFVATKEKSATKCDAVYQKSLEDLKTFKSLL